MISVGRSSLAGAGAGVGAGAPCGAAGGAAAGAVGAEVAGAGVAGGLLNVEAGGLTGGGGVGKRGAGEPGARGATGGNCVAGAPGAAAGTVVVVAIGRSAWRPIGRPQAGQKRSSLPWIAAQRGHAAMPASRRTVTGWRYRGPPPTCAARRRLARASRAWRPQLVVALAQAVHLVDQAAEVAVGELARLAQEARATTHASARAKARARGSRCGARDLLGSRAGDAHVRRAQRRRAGDVPAGGVSGPAELVAWSAIDTLMLPRRPSAVLQHRSPGARQACRPAPRTGERLCACATLIRGSGGGQVRLSAARQGRDRKRRTERPRDAARAPRDGCRRGWPARARRRRAPRARPGRSPRARRARARRWRR